MNSLNYMTNYKKIGLLGGSFNPAHEGHYFLSLYALRLFHLDEIWWLLSPANPLKQNSNYAYKDYELRRKGCLDMIQHHPQIHLCEIEQEQNLRYSWQTIKTLKEDERFNQNLFLWLMGADNLIHFHKWQNWQYIMNQVPLGIFSRPPFTKRAQMSQVGRQYQSTYTEKELFNLIHLGPKYWTISESLHLPISATQIRHFE